jgi:uncharacterized protein (UPF0147 family)
VEAVSHPIDHPRPTAVATNNRREVSSAGEAGTGVHRTERRPRIKRDKALRQLRDVGEEVVDMSAARDIRRNQEERIERLLPKQSDLVLLIHQARAFHILEGFLKDHHATLELEMVGRPWCSLPKTQETEHIGFHKQSK